MGKSSIQKLLQFVLALTFVASFAPATRAWITALR